MLDYCNFELPTVDEKVSLQGKIELYFDDWFMYIFVSLLLRMCRTQNLVFSVLMLLWHLNAKLDVKYWFLVTILCGNGPKF